MDFFDREACAQKQTRLLVCLFGLAVLAVVVLTYLIWGTIILAFYKPAPDAHRLFPVFINLLMIMGDMVIDPREYLHWLWNPKLICWTSLGTLVSIALGCLYKIRLLSAGGPAVAELLDGRRVENNSTDTDERKLRDIVQEMAVASGMSVPEIYILDRERGINSFAAGHTHDDVAIGVTLGATKLLTREELQGVIAHEFSHILNGDTRINMRLMALAHGLFWPTIAGRVLMHGTTRAPEIGESIFDEGDSPVFLPTAPLGILFLIIGAVSLPFVRILKSAICREREWLADSAAVQFTRNPAGITGALKKIGGLYKQGRLDTPYAETASHLYFANSDYNPWFNFFSTHPPLAKRILAIDPAFDGQFTHIKSLPSQPETEDPREAQLERQYEESVQHARAEAKARGELE
jgi:Zn-dependent protease with chaperone function